MGAKRVDINRAIDSVQAACPHKRGAWAVYRESLENEAKTIYEDCLRGVIR